MDSPTTNNNQGAIVQGLNFALQKFLQKSKTIAREEQILIARTDLLSTKMKKQKIKNIINKA